MDNIGLDCGADVKHDKENYARGQYPILCISYGTSNIFILWKNTLNFMPLKTCFSDILHNITFHYHHSYQIYLHARTCCPMVQETFLTFSNLWYFIITVQNGGKRQHQIEKFWISMEM